MVFQVFFFAKIFCVGRKQFCFENCKLKANISFFIRQILFENSNRVVLKLDWPKDSAQLLQRGLEKERSKVNKLTKLGKHASGVHFAKIHFG